MVCVVCRMKWPMLLPFDSNTGHYYISLLLALWFAASDIWSAMTIFINYLSVLYCSRVTPDALHLSPCLLELIFTQGNLFVFSVRLLSTDVRMMIELIGLSLTVFMVSVYVLCLFC